MGRFRSIARMIAARDIRKAVRDFFQTSLGDWDYHSEVLSRLAYRFWNLDGLLHAFVTEMKGQDVWNNVVVQVRSEFGRTLESNRGGADHGWGGNSLILSGALNGGRILNRFPASYASGNSRDAGRGRLILSSRGRALTNQSRFGWEWKRIKLSTFSPIIIISTSLSTLYRTLLCSRSDRRQCALLCTNILS